MSARRFIFVRVIWWIAALLALGFIVVGVRERYAQLSTVLPSANTLVGQLRTDQAHALEQAGISVNFYAFYLTALDTLVTLLLVSTGLAIVWFRPEDRAALLMSLFLIGIAMSAISVGMTQPRWRLAVIAAHAVWEASSVPALYLFPDGQFVPRWTRWLTAIWLIYTIAWLIFPAISPPLGFSRGFTGSELLRNLWVLVWISSGLAAQIYRYHNVSNAFERQQIKWVEFGFWSFVILFVIGGGIITLTQLAPIGGPTMVAKLAGTSIVLLGALAMPLFLGASILRHQLFDIDIIINRTLVYGALTAFVVGFYVLIVGVSGLVIQTNVILAGILVTAILAGAIYRPLRAFLQNVVDRLIPGSMGSQLDTSIHGRSKNVIDKVDVAKADPQLNTTIWENANPVQTPRRWMEIARLAWFPIFVLALGIFILSIPKFLFSELGEIAGPLYSDISSPLTLGLIRVGITIMLGAGVLSLYLALLLFRHRSSDRTGLLTSFFLLTYGVIMTGSLAALESYLPGISYAGNTILSGLVNALALFLFAIFPDGKFIPRWTRWVVLAAFLIIPLSLYFYSHFSEPPVDFSRPGVMISTALILFLYVLPWISILFAQMHRYRHVSTQQQKQQTKWVVYGLGIYFSLQIIGTIPYIYLFSLPIGSPLPPWQPVADIVYAMTIAIIPVTLTIAVMRYRLYDIDIIINRTLVYGTLTAIVVAIYGLIVGLVGVIMHTQGDLLITLLATGLIAVLFQPLRERLQRTVNRLIYGERDNPIEALSRLGKQMEVALPSDQVLPALVKTIAQTLKLPYVGIAQRGQANISFGRETENSVSFPFTFQGETTGVLLASPRGPNESFSSAETRLLQNLAGQAGVVVRNAQLTADLQRSRQTLVTAREEERHRLRRDLHDGIGPTMAGLTLKLDAARDLVSSNLKSGNKEELEETMQLLSELKTQTQETVQNIRHIVHALRPPSLDVLGLVPALQAHFGQVATPRSLNIQMTAMPQNFPRLSAAVEVAAYRIILEAVTNVINHAQAENCEVSLILENGYLKIEIKDDGMGFSRTRNHGIGLDSMRERAEELSGRFDLVSTPQGTRVYAKIPAASPRMK